MESTQLAEPPRLDPAIFSRCANRECAGWLSYVIAENHTFGVVNAWFAAFLGVTRGCLIEIARAQDPERRAFMATTSSVNFCISFDVCIKYYDEVVDSIPSLPLNSKIMTIRDTGHPEEYDKMFPEDSGTPGKYSYSGNMVL